MRELSLYTTRHDHIVEFDDYIRTVPYVNNLMYWCICNSEADSNRTVDVMVYGLVPYAGCNRHRKTWRDVVIGWSIAIVFIASIALIDVSKDPNIRKDCAKCNPLILSFITFVPFSLIVPIKYYLVTVVVFMIICSNYIHTHV